MSTIYGRLRTIRLGLLVGGGLLLIACEPIGPTPVPSELSALSFEELKATASSPTYDDLFRNNERYIGKIVYYQAQLIQVVDAGKDRYQIRANVTKSQFFWEDTMFLRYAGPRFLENDIIEFVGKVVGLTTYTAVLGNRVTIPDVSIVKAKRVGRDSKDSQESTRPTDISTPFPTATPTSPPVVLTASGTTHFLDSSGYFHLVGEIKNTTGTNIKFVKVVGTFYDSYQSVMSSESTYTDLDVIRRGEAAPFAISSYPKKIEPASYKLDVQYRVTTDEPFTGLRIKGDTSSTTRSGYFEVAGEVENASAVSAKFVKVVATFYDASNNVIGVESTYTKLDTIGAGNTSSFSLNSYPWGIAPARYKLQVDGRQD